MKKLLIAMMSVASLAFISKADAIDSGTTFEGYTGAFDAGMDDFGGRDGDVYWYTAGSSTECASLTNTDYTATYTGDKPAIHTTKTDDTPTALAVEAEQRLERGIAPRSGNTFAAQDIGSGIYFDTMVQFTATDTAPTPTAGDKLIVWLYGSGEEDGAFGIGTNLVVTAGYLANGNEVSAKHYLNGNAQINVEPNSWHRLTIKSINDIGTPQGVVGFVVFIDGTAVSTSEAKAESGEGVMTVFDNLNATAMRWNNENKLFPSLVKRGSTGAQTLTSVALEGTGMIDDISFTTTTPFAAAADNVYLTLTWDENVTAIAYAIENGATGTVDMTGDKFVLDLGAAANTYKVTLTPTYASGYGDGTWTANPTSALIGKDVTVAGTSVSVGITSYCAMFKIGDTEYGSIDALLTALETVEGKTTVKMLSDVTMAGSDDEDEPWGEYIAILEGQDIVFDLCGKTISSAYAASAAIFQNSGTLTIVDSVGGGRILADGPMAIYTFSASTLNIEAGKTDGLVVVQSLEQYSDMTGEEEGYVAPLVRLTGGSYLSDDADAFYLADYVVTGYAATYDNSYWTVAPGEGPGPGPDPTTYTVTVNVGTGTTVTDAPTKPVEENTEVTLTVGLEDGYKNLVVTVNDEETSVVDGKVTFTVTADTIVNVSATKMATYTVTIADTLNANVDSITATPTSIREDAESKIVTLTATFEDDYELDYFTVDGEKIGGNTFELTANAVVNAVAKKTVGPEPEDWPADPSTVKGQTAGDAFGLTGDMAAAPADKVATWAKAKEVSFADRTTAIKIDAYLLNVDNTDAAIIAGKAAFKFTSITPGETPTIEGTFNGVVVVKAYLDAACTTEGTSEKATFYKATLEVTAPVK